MRARRNNLLAEEGESDDSVCVCSCVRACVRARVCVSSVPEITVGFDSHKNDVRNVSDQR